ncbi:MAG: cation diffusion facilitator family transporter [Alphaproteobacteria bacterium]|nr:cation diffusion facilitator family transporter [Alphaproteobacteria bacterium]
MASPASRKVIFAALFGNLVIAVIKFAASAFTGSSAMLAEAIHSVVDTGNQGLLLYGIRAAARPPDEAHPFGYGMELYFWTFVVAILIFALGAGISIYEGVAKVIEPHPMENPEINYAVLGAAMVFEGVAWTIAVKEFRKVMGPRGWLEEVRHSKDPTIFTVLFEDTAAMAGLVVAFSGIAAAQLTGLALLDGVASIVIGLILAGTAALLAYESKELLIGEAASREVVEGIRKILAGQEGILCINEVLTMHLGPRDILCNISIDFRQGLTSDQVEETITSMERRIKSAHPQVTRIFIEAQGRSSHERSVAQLAAEPGAEPGAEGGEGGGP